jgi:hypothetical protein
VYHIPDDYMAQFSMLCDYIQQGRAQHVKLIENLGKFVDVNRCINLYIGNLYYVRDLYDVR